MGGVLIEGKFTPTVSKKYHYMQSVLQTTTRKWVDGTDLTVPYVDTPPGGYPGDKFDYFPYYADGEFPTFFDRPDRLLSRADAGKVTFQWETWIACVIDEILGADPKKANDDFYKLELLPKGFTWGFTIEKTGPGTTQPDYTVLILDFKWLDAPTAPFLNSWNTIYGNAPNTDRFNIKQGLCDNCVPLPGPLPILGLGAAFSYARRLRRLSKTLKADKLYA